MMADWKSVVVTWSGRRWYPRHCMEKLLLKRRIIPRTKDRALSRPASALTPPEVLWLCRPVRRKSSAVPEKKPGELYRRAFFQSCTVRDDLKLHEQIRLENHVLAIPRDGVLLG